MEFGRMGGNVMYMDFGKEECSIILIANPLIVIFLELLCLYPNPNPIRFSEVA